MKITDYSKIAERYENNQYRLEEIKFDADLKGYLDSHNKSKYNVLDLACGTGLYIEKQMQFFNDSNIHWNGLDPSDEMLKKASEKLDNVSLTLGYSEELPYSSDTFDFISNNYAFHHFTDKEQALDEIYRVLQKRGVYKQHNICIHDMPKWWVYHYFPSAYGEDVKRFWEKERIFKELSSRGLEVTLKIVYRLNKNKVSDYLGYAENRDISVLTLIDDKDYQEGLERMRYDIKKNPKKTIVNDFAEMYCIAQKL